MGFREDFEKFRKPKEQESSRVQLPSFEDVRKTLKQIESAPKVETTPIQNRDERNLAKLREEISKGSSISAPTGNEIPLIDSSSILKDKSSDKQGFRMSDLIIPEIRKGFDQSFGKAESGSASDVYTEMIPSFGKNRAFEIANAYQNGPDVFGYPKGVQMTDVEKNQFDGWKQKHWALLTLDASDLLGVGIAIKGGASFLSRTGLRRAVSTTSKLDNVKDIHEALLRQLPDLKGTSELDDVTDIIIASRDQNPDKLAQIVQKRVENTTLTPRPELATEAQRVTYENGVPVLRKTTPDTLLTRRSDTMEAIKGNREALRLSNADILSQEIKAGTLSTKTTAEDTISVWRVAAQGRRIRNGEEVSLVESFAKSLGEGTAPKKIEVAVSDLIRLPDGTFTFAPERLIKEAPVLKFTKNLPKEVIETTKKKEADIVAKKLAKQEAERTAKREAAASAERQLMKPVEEAKARLKALEEKASTIKVESQKKIIGVQNMTTKESERLRKTVIDGTAKINKTTRTAKQEASLKHVKKLNQAKTKLQKQKEKIRYQNELASLTEKGRKAKAELKNSVSKSSLEMKAQSKERISALKKERADNLKSANKELKDSKGETQAILKAASETPSTKSPGETGAKRSARGSSKESLKPVGEGAIKESKLYESVQERVREVRKGLGETINSKEYELYREATNKDQLAKASKFIANNDVGETIKLLETALRTGGDAVPGILNNSLLIALEPELLKSGMAKYADSLLRLSSRLSTRMGQELQILSVMDRNNPLIVLARLNKEVDKMVDSGGVLGSSAKTGTRENARKAIDELIEKSANAKKILIKEIDVNICKV